MRRPKSRRAVVVGAATVIVAAGAGMAISGSTDLRGTVRIDGGGPIPAGRLEIEAKDSAEDAAAQTATLRIDSDGKSEAIGFALPLPKGATVSPTLQVVARLERADGWLLARGSAPVASGAPLDLALYPVRY